MKRNKNNNYKVALQKEVLNELQTQLFNNLQAIDQQLCVLSFKESGKTLAGEAMDQLSDAIFNKQGNGLKTAQKWLSKFQTEKRSLLISFLFLSSNSKKNMKENMAKEIKSYDAAIKYLESFITAVNQLKTKKFTNNNNDISTQSTSNGNINFVKAFKELSNTINHATLFEGFCNKTVIANIKDWALEKEQEGYKKEEIQIVLQSFLAGYFSGNPSFLNALQEDSYEPFIAINEVLSQLITQNNLSRPSFPMIDCSKLSISKSLGKGTFACVSIGQYNNQSVAIKNFNSSVHKTDFESFQKEAEFMGQLSSPYIVKLIAVCNTKQHLALVMEYVPYGTLDQLLYEQPTLPFQTFYRIAIDVAHGLATIHQANIVHADLKVENILINTQYRAKICDFGLSSYENDSFIRRGTPTYLAPEFFFGSEGKDAREIFNSKCSDVYAYGIILLALIIQEQPFNDVWDLSSFASVFNMLSKRLNSIDGQNGYSKAIEYYENAIDTKLKQQSFIPSPQKASTFYQTMLYCCQFFPKDRPQIEDVCSRLQIEYDLLKPSP